MARLQRSSTGIFKPALLLFSASVIAIGGQPRGDDGNAPKSFSAQILSEDAGLRDKLAKSESYNSLRQGLRKVQIDKKSFYIAEGDLLLDEDQLLFYSAERELARKNVEMKREARTAPAVSPPLAHVGLVGMAENGKLVRWKPGLVLTYCILKKQFASDQHYIDVVEHMKRATQDWEEMCGISFQHRQPLDDVDGVAAPGGTVFCVREFSFGDGTIAASFFPSDPVERRKVLIDPSYFASDLPFDRVGVLRHELGHILGFRHEHIRTEAPPDCPRETQKDPIIITDYDPMSVMHYLCGRAGSLDLRFTHMDRLGAQLLYGPPLRAVKYAGDERN